MSSIIKCNTYQDANGNALFSSDGSGNVTLSAGDLKSTPAFFVQLSGHQSISNATDTKVLLDSKQIDTDNAFSSNKFTVPSGQAGKYFITVCIQRNGWGSNRLVAFIKKNGTQIWTVENFSGATYACAVGSGLFDLAVSDYLELWVYHDNGFTQSIRGNSSNSFTFMGGYKLIGA